MYPVISKAQYMLRRELWENKGGAIWTPVIIAIAACFFILLALALGKGAIGSTQIDINAVLEAADKHGLSEDLDKPVEIIDFNEGALKITTEDDLGLGAWRTKASPESYIGIFQHVSVLGFELVALIVAIVYLLGALFNDRKDRSILFWKSLPISETSNVLSKLAFAGLVIPFIALVCSIPVQLVGGITIASAFSLSDTYTFWQAFTQISLIDVFFIHVGLIVVIALKSLPLYSFILLASSVSKRSPLLIAIIVPFAISAVEWLIFDTQYFWNFIMSLFFVDRFDMQWMQSENVNRGIVAAMEISIDQIIKIAIVTAVFVSGAIWCRNNRFEI